MDLCPACGAERSEHARFCASCGASLVPACLDCGAELPAAARFCPSCGSAVSPGARPPAGQERKLVTVLFADVIGSTAIGERLDAERLTEVMTVYFDAMREEIEAEGGTVEKFIGDAVMAVFGAPVAHEDDPTRAIRAARRMQSRLDRLNHGLSTTYGVSFRQRVGVNTGEVLVTPAPQPGESIVAGDGVNVAARFEQVAEPGQIVVSERTARAARGFRYRILGPLALKGKESPVPAVAVVGEADEPARGLPGLRAPMVGRDRELALLQTLYTRAVAEARPHLATVYGDPGVGKSRLVAEFVAWAAGLEPTPTVVRGRCLPYGEGLTYWPLGEILKGQAGVQDTDAPDAALAEIRRLGQAVFAPAHAPDPARATAALAYTVGVEDPDVPLRPLSPRQVRAEMHAAWRAFFTALAAQGPLVAVVEDIHWADPALLHLLEELAERSEGPIVLVCPARPELAERRPSWGGGRANSSSIVLEPLPLAEADRLVGLLLPVEDLPRSLHDRILRRAEGNPFFLEEILRQFIDEGVIVRDGARWHCLAEVGDVAIPDTVQAVLAARIDLLEPAEKRALQHAAVVGRVFWPGPLDRLAGDDAGPLDDVIASLEERDLVSSRLGSAIAGQLEYVFKHALVRDVAYESLPRRERPAAHAAVARWVEETAGERTLEFVELLAYHYLEAYRGRSWDSRGDEAAESDRCRAFDHLLRASADARSKLALAKAQRLAEQAVEIASGDVERAGALEALGEAYHADYQGDDAWRAFRGAADARLASDARDPTAVAYICARAVEMPTRWPGTMRDLPAPEEVRRYLEAGLERVGPEDSSVRVRLLTAVSMLPFAFFYQGVSEEELSEAKQAGEEATDMALRLDEPVLASAALDGVTSVCTVAGRYGEMLGTEERRLALAPRLSDPAELGDLYALAASAYFHVGRYREAAEIAERGVELTLADAPSFGMHCLTWKVTSLFGLGAWDAALEAHALLEASLGERWRDPPRPYLRAAAVAAFMREARGERVEADRQLGVLEAIADVQKTRSATGPSWVVRTLARRGAFAEAREWLERLRWREGLGLKLEALCELIAEEGRWQATARVAAEAREEAAWGGLLALPYYASRLEGRAALATGDARRAIPSLVEAREGFARLDARFERACTDLALGEALLIVDRPDEARASLQEGLDVFEELSSRRELEHARELLR